MSNSVRWARKGHKGAGRTGGQTEVKVKVQMAHLELLGAVDEEGLVARRELPEERTSRKRPCHIMHKVIASRKGSHHIIQ